MNKTIGQASIRRSGERRPLRLEIARRRAHTASGAEKFVTEVRFGDAAALVVPWREDRRRALASRRNSELVTT